MFWQARKVLVSNEEVDSGCSSFVDGDDAQPLYGNECHQNAFSVEAEVVIVSAIVVQHNL